MSTTRAVVVIFSLATFFFALMVACAKAVAPYPVSEITFFRSFFACVGVTLYILVRHGPQKFKTNRAGDHFMRGLFGVGSMLCSFSSYKLLPLAEASALGHAQPLFLAVFSVLLLKERSRSHRWVAVCAGFLGVLLMLNPEGQGTLHGALFALVGAFFGALAMVQVRRLGSTESSLTVVFYFMLYASVVSAILVAPLWITPSDVDLLLLLATGIFGALGQVLMVEGYIRAEASLVASFNYLQVVWAAIIGFIVWHEVPRVEVVCGVLIIFGSQLFLLQRERRMNAEALGAVSA